MIYEVDISKIPLIDEEICEFDMDDQRAKILSHHI